MRYFHSNKNFNQYKPHQTFWQKWKSDRKKREVKIELSESTLKNPFKREVVKKNRSKKIIWIIFGILFISWVFLIIYLPYFTINKVEIIGNKITSSEEINYLINQSKYFKNSFIPKKNYFTFADIALAEEIKTTFLFEGVTVKKIFPNSIRVIITEKPASIIYTNNSAYLLLDADGKLIKKIQEVAPVTEKFSSSSTTSTDEITTTTTSSPKIFDNQEKFEALNKDYGGLPIIIENGSIEVSDNNYISSNIIKFVHEWKKELKEQGIGDAKYFTIDSTGFNIKISTDQPWYIYANTDLESKIQLKNLKIILTNNKPLEYIDLRFGERVYWK